MRNFISEDDIEKAVLSKLKEEPFDYDVIMCDASPDNRDDLNDGTGRSSKKECVLPTDELSDVPLNKAEKSTLLLYLLV